MDLVDIDTKTYVDICHEGTNHAQFRWFHRAIDGPQGRLRPFQRTESYTVINAVKASGFISTAFSSRNSHAPI